MQIFPHLGHKMLLVQIEPVAHAQFKLQAWPSAGCAAAQFPVATPKIQPKFIRVKFK
jgi:hypothetical protein